MSGELRETLLNRETFDSLIKTLKLKTRDMEEYREEIELVLSDLQEDRKVSKNVLIQYKSNVRKIEGCMADIELVLDSLDDKAENSKQEKIAKKVRAGYETEKQAYEDIQDELDSVIKSKRLDKEISNLPDESLQGSMISSTRYSGEMMQDDLPVIKAYDQEQFVQKRGEQIKQIKNEAQQLNAIAGEVNGMIHKQDRDLDAFTKKLEKNRDVVVKANENLEAAEERQRDSRKNLGCWVILIAILLAGIVIFVLYQMGVFKSD
jgi:t-SNARE complex subunit (syntaxin)